MRCKRGVFIVSSLKVRRIAVIFNSLKLQMEVYICTRQMIIIVGGDLMCRARHGMLSERVGFMHARKHYVCASLVQNSVCTCCSYVDV